MSYSKVSFCITFVCFEPKMIADEIRFRAAQEIFKGQLGIYTNS